MKRTYQPHNVSRLRTHGFRARMATAGGRKVLSNRRRKGRYRLAVGTYQKLGAGPPRAPSVAESQGPGASSPPGQGFPKARRLRRRPSFLAAQRLGRRAHAEHLTFVVAPNPAPGASRVGLTVSKQVGNAVERTRVKRLLREIFRRGPEWLPPGAALVVIARPGAAALTQRAMLDEWQKVAGRLRQLGAWAASQAGQGKGPVLS